MEKIAQTNVVRPDLKSSTSKFLSEWAAKAVEQAKAAEIQMMLAVANAATKALADQNGLKFEPLTKVQEYLKDELPPVDHTSR